MNKLFDLRFVIGSFFSVVGILLLLYGFFSNKSDMQEVNKWCGGIFLIFGMIMIIFSRLNKTKDQTHV